MMIIMYFIQRCEYVFQENRFLTLQQYILLKKSALFDLYEKFYNSVGISSFISDQILHPNSFKEESGNPCIIGF